MASKRNPITGGILKEGQKVGGIVTQTPNKSTVAPKTTTTTTPAKTNTATANTNLVNTSPAVVETERPAWIPTGNNYQGGSSGGSSNNSYDAILKAIEREERQRKDNQLASLRAAFDKSRQDYETAKPGIMQTAADWRNQVDTQYYTQGLPSLYAAMEAAGQRGGENITGRVALDTMRGQGHVTANQFEKTQLANIENAILGLGPQQAQAEADILAGISADTFDQRLSALKGAMSMDLQNLNTAKSDFVNTIGAYYDNFQAEINRLTQLQSQGVTTDGGVPIAFKIAALKAARNQKIQDQEAAAYEAQMEAERNAQAWARIYNAGSNESPLEYEEALILYEQGNRTPRVLKALGLQ
jgi:hypothetical protein